MFDLAPNPSFPPHQCATCLIARHTNGTQEQDKAESTLLPCHCLCSPAPILSTHLQAEQVQGIRPRHRWVQEGRSWEEKGMAASGDGVDTQSFLVWPAFPLTLLSVSLPFLLNTKSSQMRAVTNAYFNSQYVLNNYVSPILPTLHIHIFIQPSPPPCELCILMAATAEVRFSLSHLSESWSLSGRTLVRTGVF